MTRRTLVMLTSHRPSSKYRQTISREEAEAFWNGYFTLWHPQVVAESAGPPTLGSQDEFETPAADHLFVIPESPYRYQSADWAERMKEAGSHSFVATPSWDETFKQLEQTLGKPLVGDNWIPFAGLGLGYLILEAYCDAQDHANALDTVGFYEHVRLAALATDASDRKHHLGQAAHQLQQAREVVNPSQLYQAVTLFLKENTTDSSESKLNQWLHSDLAFTIVAGGHWMTWWLNQNKAADRELLRAKLQSGKIDWWGGNYFERPDALMPLSSWLASLDYGMSMAQNRLGKRLESSGRSRFAATANMPGILQSFGLKRAFGFSNDAGVWPSATNSLAAWRGPDSQLLESCTRKPEPLDSAETAFHLGHLIYDSTSSEYVGWIHFGMMQQLGNIPLWFQCWNALHQLAPVFGQLGNLEQTIRDIPATEQYTPPSADDFQSDYLLEMTGQGDQETIVLKAPYLISYFSFAHREWREWEVARTLLSLYAVITPSADCQPDIKRLERYTYDLLNDQGYGVEYDTSLNLKEIATTFAERLISGATSKAPGYLLFNPCSFSRKVPVQLPLATTLLPVPAWASQKGSEGIDAIVELPPLGFAWLPRSVEKGAKVRVPKHTIAEGTTLKNDYLIVEIDPHSGGIRSIKDAIKEIPRLGQQLVFAPGSTMKCDEVKVTKNGHAVGEVQSKGTLVDAHGEELADYVQTCRLWAGRKIAEIDIHLEPRHALAGYPWHAYFASRWAWRDPNARLNKSVQWTKLPSTQTRPETPGFIELEMSQGRVTIFSGGLPFWQRYTSRMLDSILLVEDEASRDFSFAISLDDDLPHLTEQDWLTPTVAIPVEQGPPLAGTSSWLFHIDAPSVMLIDMHITEDRPKSVILRMVETFGYATETLLQCPRQPSAAFVVNSLGEPQRSIDMQPEGIVLRVGCYEFLQLRLDFA
ncbi:MAG TPA: hypothetical protein PLN21_20480 [Gemmatales bacterium]|nr:hypothetical protein [Gemmatales bacterium]